MRRATLLMFLGIPSVLAAQVGHDPSRSPYRTLRHGQFFGATGGLFRGDGGQLGVAPHHGWSGGIRYDLFTNGTVTLGFATSLARLERVIIDPNLPIAFAAVDTVEQGAFFGETIIQFNITGGKTWNRLAPFVSAGLGVVVAGATPADESGFSFRAKMTVAPGVGTRIYLSERLFLRLEARSVFWQVTYPATFRQSPSTAPSQPPVLAAPAKEWLANGWYVAGLSYAFRRPF
ncbi:MAG TPA: hypothetical protein VI383_02605 [Gemmatimonadales bacterium]|nr:hypothetical protein [Gemmatimonadales bacterium]